MHKILLNDDVKTSVEHQRRLNPIMKDVVRKELLKWLNTGFIYAISYSVWVSPVHVVPKKGGLTMIRNERNEHHYKNCDMMKGVYRLQKIEYCNQERSFYFAFH